MRPRHACAFYHGFKPWKGAGAAPGAAKLPSCFELRTFDLRRSPRCGARRGAERVAARVGGSRTASDGIHKIRHVIVIMQENRSFDSYFGTFPGADGIPMRDGVPKSAFPTR